MRIECSACGRQHVPTATFGCSSCGAELTVEYAADLDPDRARSGRTLFEKYGTRLPSSGSVAGIEGSTPLIRAESLERTLDCDATVYLKDERRNPTGSFKDRAFAPTVSLAAEAGIDALVTASSGNAATACAHYARRGGLTCYLLVPASTPRGKLVEPSTYGATVVRVSDLFDRGEREFLDLLEAVATEVDAYPALAYQAANPVPAEGVKTISYEVANDLDRSAPDVVVTPTGGGDNLAAQFRGYRELERAEVIDRTPRMVAAQADGAAPLARAIETDRGTPVPIEDPDTVASGIGAPFAGQAALEAVRASDGTALAVGDERILDGASTLARSEAVWPEPASGAVVPALAELDRQGELAPDDVVVLTITGSGYKDVDRFERRIEGSETVATDVDEIARLCSG